jgi:hypothetical protein
MIEWIRRFPQPRDCVYDVANRNFTSPQPPGLSLYETGYHRSHAFRYGAELRGLMSQCPAREILSADNCCQIVKRSARLRAPRLRRSAGGQQLYYVLLSKMYLRWLRRLRRQTRSPRTLHSEFRHTSNGLRTRDWLYLLVRAHWEQRSLWSLDDLSTREGRFTIAEAIEFGETLHQFAAEYFSFPDLDGNAKEWSYNAWARLHLSAIVFAETVRRIGSHLNSGGLPEHAESAVRAFDRDDLPFVVFRPPAGDDAAEIYVWRVPDHARRVVDGRIEVTPAGPKVSEIELSCCSELADHTTTDTPNRAGGKYAEIYPAAIA